LCSWEIYFQPEKKTFDKSPISLKGSPRNKTKRTNQQRQLACLILLRWVLLFWVVVPVTEVTEVFAFSFSVAAKKEFCLSNKTKANPFSLDFFVLKLFFRRA
jgi:hypothetical protein